MGVVEVGLIDVAEDEDDIAPGAGGRAEGAGLDGEGGIPPIAGDEGVAAGADGRGFPDSRRGKCAA